MPVETPTCDTCKHCSKSQFGPPYNFNDMCTEGPEWQPIKRTHHCGRHESGEQS